MLKITAKIVIILTLLIVLVSGVFVWHLADNIAQPPRRALQDYHNYWLQNADIEGIVVTSFDCASGKMPCLFVTAKPDATLGIRGQAIRTQLKEDFGRELLPYEVTAKAPRGIVVLLHGRVGRKEDLLPVAARLVASGFVCVLPDMPAHGDSRLTHSRFGAELVEHHPNLINQSLQDIRVWLGEESRGERIDGQVLPAFIWGMSMGGSYANYAMHESMGSNSKHKGQDEWQGAIIVSSFAKLEQIVDRQAESIVRPLPKSLHNMAKTPLIHLFDTFIKWQGGAVSTDINPAIQARDINLPVLQFHGDKDTTIDISQGRQLFESYPNRDKTWVTVDGAGHNNVLITNAPVYATMADWLLEHTD